jgi:hypothetical protein
MRRMRRQHGLQGLCQSQKPPVLLAFQIRAGRKLDKSAHLVLPGAANFDRLAGLARALHLMSVMTVTKAPPMNRFRREPLEEPRNSLQFVGLCHVRQFLPSGKRS